MFSALGRWGKSFSESCKYLGASLAIVMVKRKLRRRPHDWTLWLTVARLYEIGDQWSLAFDALERARRLDPNNSVIAHHLARVREAAKRDPSDRRKSDK